MEEKNESTDLPLLKEKKERCLIEKSADPCLICAVPTQKLHLQVNACYACSAFYRRSLDTWKTYKCQNNNEKCDLTIKSLFFILKLRPINKFTEEGKPLCRLCRYKRCVEIGMVINKKDEINKDEDKKEVEQLKDESVSDSLLEIMNLPSISEEAILADMEKNFKELRKIFSTNVPEPPDENYDYTKEFTELVKTFVESFKPKVTLIPYNGSQESVQRRVHFVNNHFFATAKMLSKFQPFAALPIVDKISLFCHFWNIFRSFERIFQAILYFKNTDETDYRLQCGYSEYYDINNIKTIYHTSIPNPTFYSLMLPVFLKGKLLISTFKKVNPTFEEFVYICHTGLWSCHEIIKISSETQALAEKITNKISENLHNYYVDELRVASYSSRQAQLFKLISLAEVVLRSRKQMIAGRKLFNFGQYYFPYCNFETNFFDYIDKNQL